MARLAGHMTRESSKLLSLLQTCFVESSPRVNHQQSLSLQIFLASCRPIIRFEHPQMATRSASVRTSKKSNCHKKAQMF